MTRRDHGRSSVADLASELARTRRENATLKRRLDEAVRRLDMQERASRLLSLAYEGVPQEDDTLVEPAAGSPSPWPNRGTR